MVLKFAIQTVFEILLVVGIIYGFIKEDKLIAYEEEEFIRTRKMTEAYLASGTEVLEVNHLTQFHLREECPLRCNTLIIIGLTAFESLKLIVSHLDEDRLVLSRHARRECDASGSVHIILGFEDETAVHKA